MKRIDPEQAAVTAVERGRGLIPDWANYALRVYGSSYYFRSYQEAVAYRDGLSWYERDAAVIVEV